MEPSILMKKLIEEFPNNLLEALSIAKKVTFKKPKNTIQNVVICGMGGSGIGGRIVAQWLEKDLTVPVNFCQDYHLPSYVNQNTLVIASSYSGNTEETLMSLETAIQKNAHIIAITSGGSLEALCKENGFDYVIVPGGNPPRTAMAFSLVQLVNIFNQIGMCPVERLTEIKKGHDLIVTELEGIIKQAQEIAAKLKDKIPVFYSPGSYEAMAIRARQQFNENSKKIGWAGAIPEMNHNELVGWSGGDNRFGVVFLNTKDLIKRNQKRLEITLDRLRTKTDTVINLEAKGNSKIEKTLYLNSILDWASLYTADLNNVDCVEIEIIDYLKDSLSKI